MNYGKEVYDNIEIPEELPERIEAAIEWSKKKKARERSRRISRIIRTIGTMAACFLICITIGVNSSQVFAQGVGNLPVIGALARVLTVRDFETSENSVTMTVKVPGIEAVTEEDAQTAVAQDGAGNVSVKEESAFVADINAEINRIVDEFLEKTKTDMEEYKEAFFATGGTEEEWADRDMDVHVTYDVKYQEGSILSLVLHAEEAWVAAYQENYYYNLDLEKQRNITLEDLLGPDYIAICNESIVRQIEEQMQADEDKMYFGYGPEADELDEEIMFKTITPETNFYINEKGNPVICFAKYEIAPGYMGVCEFEILQNY